jgi:hypothetical protein
MVWFVGDEVARSVSGTDEVITVMVLLSALAT